MRPARSFRPTRLAASAFFAMAALALTLPAEARRPGEPAYQGPGDPSTMVRDGMQYPMPKRFHQEMYTFGKLVEVNFQKGYMVLEPPGGLDNLWPASTTVMAKIEQERQRNSPYYKMLMRQQANIRLNGGVKVFFTPANLLEAGADPGELQPGRWAFVPVGRSHDTGLHSAKNVYVYDSLAEMKAAQTNDRWNVTELIADNIFMVFYEMEMPQPGDPRQENVGKGNTRGGRVINQGMPDADGDDGGETEDGAPAVPSCPHPVRDAPFRGDKDCESEVTQIVTVTHEAPSGCGASVI